jgi:hypothetical protein
MQKTWVLFAKNFSIPGRTGPAVCTQAEWDAMEAEFPGRHTLIKSSIPSEAEAERLARRATVADPTALDAGGLRLPDYSGVAPDAYSVSASTIRSSWPGSMSEP